MNTQLYVQIGATGSWTNLDLMETDPIRLTVSSENLEDPSEIPSTFSKEFRVPGSAKNNEFFKNAFMVNAQDFDASLKANAYIIVEGVAPDSEPLVNGNIRLSNIYVNERTGSVEYEILFMGDVSNFSSSIAEGYLSDLDLSEWNHELTMENIEDSWDLNLFRGAIVYPFVEWGYTYYSGPTGPTGPAFIKDPPEQIQFSANQKNLFSMVQRSIPAGYPVTQPGLTKWHFKPSIQIRALLEKIFNSNGFTFTSTFMNTQFFRNLYLVSDSEARWTLRDALTIDARIGTDQTISVNFQNRLLPLTFNSVIYDKSNMTPQFRNFTNGGTYFEVPVTDTYAFTINFQFYHPYDFINPAIFSTTKLHIKKLSGGVATTLFTDTQTANSTNSWTATFDIVYSGTFNKGDLVYYEWEWDSGSVAIRRPGIEKLNWRVFCETLQVRPNMVLPTDIKQADFIKSVFQRFKMVMYQNSAKKNDFIIEPWSNWSTSGATKDWTRKVDWGQDVVYTPLFYTQNREYMFTDQEDSDLPNAQFTAENDRIFGELLLNSGNQLITDRTEVESIFAPTPTNLVFGTTDSFIIPNIYECSELAVAKNIFINTTDEEPKRTPISPKPRLLYFEGVKPTGKEYFIRTDINTLESRVFYPKFTYLAPTSRGIFDLNWKNEIPYWTRFKIGADPLEGRTELTAYSVYWKGWLEDVWNGFSRKMTCQVKLTYDDIRTLKLNDKIWIKDSYWRILNISDIPVGQDAVVECEFIKSPSTRFYTALEADRVTNIKIDIEQ